MKAFLTVKNQCILQLGWILALAGFGPKGRIPAFLQCFCCFSSKVQKLAKPIFTDVGCSFFGNPSQKKSHSDWKFRRFSDFQRKKKELVCKAPFGQGEGVNVSPKRHKKSSIPAFLRCFLVLQKIPKKGCEPTSQGEAFRMHFYSVFLLLLRGENLHFS